MTYCKNCHKMSRDDDFCSHCGSAVWSEDDVSADAAVRCDSLKEHTHDKVTYDRTERGDGVHIPEGYKPYNPTNSTKTNNGKKSKSGTVVFTGAALIVILKIIIRILKAILR